MKNLLVIMLVVVALTTIGNAQESVTTTAPVATTKAAVELFAAANSTKIVKGAPFSAEAVSESIQTLADGNRITRSNTTKMYRDSEGRFRREGTGGSANNGGFSTAFGYGGFFTAYGFQEGISIFDPVEGVRYTLTPTTKSARRYTNQNVFTQGAVTVNGQLYTDATKARTELEKLNITKAEVAGAPKASVVVMGNIAAAYNMDKGESLGTKTIEGIQAEGTRHVTTIAAGAIGNEKPIEIFSERWYSKELDLIVFSRHYDPRFGEQIYRLTNVSRSEPDRSLFTVPSDYKIVAETPLKFYTTKPQ